MIFEAQVFCGEFFDFSGSFSWKTASKFTVEVELSEIQMPYKKKEKEQYFFSSFLLVPLMTIFYKDGSKELS